MEGSHFHISLLSTFISVTEEPWGPSPGEKGRGQTLRKDGAPLGGHLDPKAEPARLPWILWTKTLSLKHIQDQYFHLLAYSALFSINNETNYCCFLVNFYLCFINIFLSLCPERLLPRSLWASRWRAPVKATAHVAKPLPLPAPTARGAGGGQ